MAKDRQSSWELYNSSELGKAMLAKYPKMTKESLDNLDNRPPMSDEEFLKFQEINKDKFKNLFKDDTNTDTPT